MFHCQMVNYSWLNAHPMEHIYVMPWTNSPCIWYMTLIDLEANIREEIEMQQSQGTE